MILSRRVGDAVFIGKDIKVVFLERRGVQIRLGIEAPDDLVILREELLMHGDQYAFDRRRKSVKRHKDEATGNEGEGEPVEPQE